MNRREIGIQAQAPMRRRGQKYTEEEKEIWMKGRNAGIFLTLNFITPIPIEQMNKDLLRLTASLLNIPGYSNMRDYQLLEAIRNRGVQRAGIKRRQGGNGFELVRVPRA